MTPAEAEAVAAAIAEADGGCSVCVPSITGQLMTDIPDVDWPTLVWPYTQPYRSVTSKDFAESAEFYRKQTIQSREWKAREDETP